MAEMLQLRAWLVDSDPEIWRQVLVDPRFTLEQLHTVLQHAFGWTNSHLHQFQEKDGRRYAKPSREDWGDPVIDERKACLREVFDRAGRRIAYEYDFGDSWIHAIELEKRVDSEKVEYPFETFVKEGKSVFSGKSRAAICIAGERSGPPEDCGGLYGFFELLEIKQKSAAKRSDDEHERLGWLGDEWDFDLCDLSRINEMLGKMRVKKAMMGL